MSDSGRRFRAAVLVVSDRVAAGTHQDASGPAASDLLKAWGAEIAHLDVVPDEPPEIRARILQYTDQERLDLVITSGGTGFAPRDITPEATRSILEKEAPGISELMRRETAQFTAFAALSRGVAGIRGKTLVVNLPGSPKAVVQCLEAIQALIPHAVRVLGDQPAGHAPPRPASAPESDDTAC